jgi:hypothetical protein
MANRRRTDNTMANRRTDNTMAKKKKKDKKDDNIYIYKTLHN